MFMGFPKDYAEAQQHERQSIKYFELFESNIETVTIFKGLETQFNYLSGTSRPVPVGLNYAGVIAELELLYSRKKSKRLFREIKEVEQGYIKAIHNGKNHPDT